MNLLMVETSKVQVRNNYRHKLELDAEFVASVKQHGVIEPIIVRKASRGQCELVAGARRLAAAKKLKLKRVPCVMRDELTDAEAIALGVVENTQRLATNLLDESEAVARMVAEGWSVKDVATHLGRSVSHVTKVAALQRLSKASKDLLAEGELALDAAFQLARLGLPAKEEREAALRLAGNEYQKPRAAKEAADLLGRDYMLRLKDAPFVLSDAELLPKAGACSRCGKRSGQQQDLFGDVKAKDVCLDRACYQKKLEAFWAMLKDQHPDDVLDGSKDLFEKGGFLLAHQYVDLDADDFTSGKKWRSLVPKDTRVLYARDLEGRLRRLAKKPKERKKREADAEHRARTGRTRDEEKVRREARRANRARADEMYADCRRAFAPTGPVLYWMVCGAIGKAWRTTLVEWLVRHGEDEKAVKSSVDAKLRELVEQKAELQDGTGLTVMLFELSLCELLGAATFDEVPPELVELHDDVLGFQQKESEGAEGSDPADV